MLKNMLLKAIHKSQHVQRNWDLSKSIPEEDLAIIEQACLGAPSKQNVTFFKPYFITDRDVIEKIHRNTLGFYIEDGKKGDWEYTFRHREGGKHIEIGNKIGPVEVMYRYADLVDTQENRIKFTGEFFSYKDLVFEGRMEYRHFNNKESHWRYRFIAEYTPHLYGPFYLYAKWQPRWSFKDSGTKFDARDQLGITYKQNNWKVTPFIERKSTEGYDKKMTVTGIHWEAKL